MVEKDIKQKKETLSDIILQHLKKILELSTHEFCGGYEKEVVIDNRRSTIYVPNSRKQYIQAVESLSDVLLPFFDKEIQKPSNEIIKKIDSITAAMEKKEDTLIKRNKELSDIEIRYYTKNKLKLCRQLFRELNHLIERGGIFK